MAIVGPHGAASAVGALLGGADIVQVRARDLPGRELAALVRAVVAGAGSGERVIVNGRPDIARLAGARGVHLPETGFDPSEVRRSFPGLLIGVSRHDRRGIERAAKEGADYAILGPVFATPGKEERALGLEAWAACVRGVSIPVLAVGGVSPESASSVLAAGAFGVAAIRPFADASRAPDLASAFRRVLD